MSRDRANVKKSAWKYFSIYIRFKECKETTGNPEFGKCCTCGRIYPRAKLDAGHFIPGRGDNVLFVEDIVHIQCQSCNRFAAGRLHEFLDYMIKRYGRERVEQIRQMRFLKKSYTLPELTAIKDHYKNLIKKVENG